MTSEMFSSCQPTTVTPWTMSIAMTNVDEPVLLCLVPLLWNSTMKIWRSWQCRPNERLLFHSEEVKKGLTLRAEFCVWCVGQQRIHSVWQVCHSETEAPLRPSGIQTGLGRSANSRIFFQEKGSSKERISDSVRKTMHMYTKWWSLKGGRKRVWAVKWLRDTLLQEELWRPLLVVMCQVHFCKDTCFPQHFGAH